MKKCHKCGKFHKSNAEIAACGNPVQAADKKEEIIPETVEKVVEKIVTVIKEPEVEDVEVEDTKETEGKETEGHNEVEQNKNNPLMILLLIMLIILIGAIVLFRDAIFEKLMPKEGQ